MLQAEVDVKTGALLGAPRHIWKGTGGQHAEAPHTYKIGGVYYLMLAEGGTSYGHMVTIARSETVWGPWEECPHNPILTHRSLDIPVQATGHGDLVETPDGAWWMVFLAVRPDMGHPRAYHLGRETFIAPVCWENGWPVVADKGRLTPKTPLPAAKAPESLWQDDFSSTDFKPEWNFLRNPESGNYRLDGEGLRLFGTGTRLDEAASPTWIGRRQQHLACEFSAEVECQPTTPGRVGLSVYMDESHHYDVAIRGGEGGRILLEVLLRIGPIHQVVACRELAAPRVCLFVRAEAQRYHLGILEDGGFVELASPRVRYLTTEVAQGFTGVYFALFAEGEGAEGRVCTCRYRPDGIVD